MLHGSYFDHGKMIPLVDFMKINAEGMEVEVLQGAKETIGRCKLVLTLEIIKTDKAAVTHFLAGPGYSIYPLGINLYRDACGRPTQAKLAVGRNGGVTLNMKVNNSSAA
jgi:hypothetical protein